MSDAEIAQLRAELEQYKNWLSSLEALNAKNAEQGHNATMAFQGSLNIAIEAINSKETARAELKDTRKDAEALAKALSAWFKWRDRIAQSGGVVYATRDANPAPQLEKNVRKALDEHGAKYLQGEG